MSNTIQSTSTPESADLVRKFLSGHRSGVLATADASANPLATVVYYTFKDDFSLTFGTKTETQKYKNIEENKQVAFVVYDESGQTTAQVTGRAELITDEEERQQVMNSMVKSSAELSQTDRPPAEKLIAGDYVALRIIPSVIKLAVYARPDSEGDDLYETLLFSE